MTRLINFDATRRNTNDKLPVDALLESELVGLVKQLYWSQMEEAYDKRDLIYMMSSHLNYQNRCFIEDFIEEHPTLKIKYRNLVAHDLKKSAN